MLIIGIDDAGRGPLIGPMMLAGVLVEEKDERLLKEEGVADSKQLTHPVRVKLAEIIKETANSFHVVSTTPVQIDQALNNGINLNTLEALKTAEIINKLNMKKEKIKVIVDCPSVNTKSWRATLIGYIHHSENLDVYCEHKADVNHPSVSAASILAKVAREEAVAKLQEEYGDMGSGYPSDPTTITFLKKHGWRLKEEGIFRKSWSTWKQLFPEANQKTLREF
ncbi:MAG: ribonuclease HII [Nanoarchaeota archaeon]